MELSRYYGMRDAKTRISCVSVYMCMCMYVHTKQKHTQKPKDITRTNTPRRLRSPCTRKTQGKRKKERTCMSDSIMLTCLCNSSISGDVFFCWLLPRKSAAGAMSRGSLGCSCCSNSLRSASLRRFSLVIFSASSLDLVSSYKSSGSCSRNIPQVRRLSRPFTESMCVCKYPNNTWECWSWITLIVYSPSLLASACPC
jgi:hypothetical protein